MTVYSPLNIKCRNINKYHVVAEYVTTEMRQLLFPPILLLGDTVCMPLFVLSGVIILIIIIINRFV